MQNEDNWTVADILQHRNNWNLAADAKLLGCIEHLSEKVLRNAEITIKALNGLECELEETSVNISTIDNRFHLLADKQFIESKVADEETHFHETDKQGTPGRAMISNTDTSHKLRESLDNGIGVIDAYYDVIEVKGSDSEDEQHAGEIVLKARNRYASRKLPHMIGSEKFMRNDHVGISEISSSEEEENDEGEEEEEEEYTEVEKSKKLVMDSGGTETDESDSDTDISTQADSEKVNDEENIANKPKLYSDRINFANELAERLRLNNKQNDNISNDITDESFTIPPHVGDSSCPPPFPTNSSKDSDESEDELLFSDHKDNDNAIMDGVEDEDEFSKNVNLYDDESTVDNMFNSLQHENSKNQLLYGLYRGHYTSNEPPEDISNTHDNTDTLLSSDQSSTSGESIILSDNQSHEIDDYNDDTVRHVETTTNSANNQSTDNININVNVSQQPPNAITTITNNNNNNYTHNQNKQIAPQVSTIISDSHRQQDIFSVGPVKKETYTNAISLFEHDDDDQDDLFAELVTNKDSIAKANILRKQKVSIQLKNNEHEHEHNKLTKKTDINEQHKPQNNLSINKNDVLSSNNNGNNENKDKDTLKSERVNLPGKLSVDRRVNIDVNALLPKNMWPSRTNKPPHKEIETINNASETFIKLDKDKDEYEHKDEDEVNTNVTSSPIVTNLLPTVVKHRARIPGKRRPPSRRITRTVDLNVPVAMDEENEVNETLNVNAPSQITKDNQEKLESVTFGINTIPNKMECEKKLESTNNNNNNDEEKEKDVSMSKRCIKTNTNLFEEDMLDEDLFSVKSVKGVVDKSNSKKNNDYGTLIEDEDGDLFGALGRNKIKQLLPKSNNVKESGGGTSLFDDSEDSDDENSLFKTWNSKTTTCNNVQCTPSVSVRVDGKKPESNKSRLVKLKGKAANDDPLKATK